MDKKSKARRSFSEEFKRSAVRLVTEEGYSMVAASKAVGVDNKCIREWCKKFGGNPKAWGSRASKEDLQAEVKRLEKQLRRTEMERDILKKATAYFAKESQ
jgi:transposase